MSLCIALWSFCTLWLFCISSMSLGKGLRWFWVICNRFASLCGRPEYLWSPFIALISLLSNALFCAPFARHACLLLCGSFALLAACQLVSNCVFLMQGSWFTVSLHLVLETPGLRQDQKEQLKRVLTFRHAVQNYTHLLSGKTNSLWHHRLL